MKKLVLAAALALFLVQVGALQSGKDISVNSNLNNCLLFIDAPPEVVYEDTNLTFRSANWNCGNVDFNGTTNLTLYNYEGKTVKKRSHSINLTAGDYNTTKFNWTAHKNGTYRIVAETEHTGNISGELFTDYEHIEWAFYVADPDYFNGTDDDDDDTTEDTDDETTDPGGFPGGGFQDEVPTTDINVDLKAGSKIREVIKGHALVLNPEIINHGSTEVENLSISIDTPLGWQSSEAYISTLPEDSSISREIVVRTPENAEETVYSLEGSLERDGSILDTQTFLVEVVPKEQKKPLINIREYSRNIRLPLGEEANINYTLENSGNAPTGEIDVYLQNERNCITQFARKHDSIEPNETLKGYLKVRAGNSISQCNISLIAKSPESTDIVNIQVETTSIEELPISLPKIDEIPEEYYLYIALLLGLLSLLGVFEERKKIKPWLPAIPHLRSEKKSYECDECGKAFDSKRGLKVHYGKAHKDKATDEKEMINKMRRIREKLNDIEEE